MGHRHVAGSAMHDALEKRSARVRNVVPAPAVITGQSLLHLVPDQIADDALMLSRIDLATVSNDSGIDRICQKGVERGFVERTISGDPALFRSECLRPPAAPLEFLEDQDG
jgi:hypothetical protein